MHVQTLAQSPRNHRGGQVSHLLLGKGQFGSEKLAITWVDCAPGSEQAPHAHAEHEQAYVIVRGRGLMVTGDEQQEVGPGTVVFIPPDTSHFIRNTGEELLVYVSATSPPFDMPSRESGFSYVPPGS